MSYARYAAARTIATTRLDRTARNTGRGGLRNWRQRTSAQERWRTSGAAGRRSSGARSATAEDGQRPSRRERPRRVGRQQLDAAEESVELGLAGERSDTDAKRVDQRHGPDDREDAGTQLLVCSLCLPAGD